MTRTITIFEMGGCCSTSLTSPETYSELQRLDRDTDILRNNGVELICINVAMKPDLLAQIPNIDDYLSDKGIDIFPLTIMENKVAKEKEYPTQAELTAWTGIEIKD